MAFPVDLLDNYSHEDLESSGEDYLADLRCGDPENPEFLTLANNVPVCLSTVGFIPLYGGEERHKVLALFAPEDSLAAVALFLADQWWTIDDIVRTSVSSREGLLQVKSIGERVVLYVLNRLIYRKQEIEKNECPFLCHGSHDYAKILWKKGEAIGFYSVKLPACQKYFERYPGDHDLLWEVEGTGHWHQRTPVAAVLQRESFKHIGTVALEQLNGELMEDAIKVSIMTEGQTASEVTDGDSKLSSENTEEATLTLLVPLILDPSVKSTEESDDNASDKVRAENMAEGDASLEEEEQATQRKRTLFQNSDSAAAADKEEPANNGLSNSVATEAPEDTISENVSPNTTSSLEEQSEEGGSDSPEAPVVLGQGALVMVELEDISYQQHTEGPKNQLDEQSEESAEPASERAADSSSEEAEIEVPVVDRRTLRRKAKGYKGPPKKKGKLI
uniref:Family with sequence similarity 169 member A n=1 Tax=Salvator merianae TaxID=96440 RepID=A0A8D0DLV0_SALMN